jgi:hypothetical protein
MKVVTPEVKSAMLTKKDVSVTPRSSAPARIRGGVMIPTNIASTCWTPHSTDVKVSVFSSSS